MVRLSFKKMKINALAKIDNKTFPCTGKIEIHWVKEPQAYITWDLFSNENENLIISKSENYFFRKNIDTEENLIHRIIKKIENCRVGRKKIFSKVRLSC
jgi:hypothetical protein